MAGGENRGCNLISESLHTGCKSEFLLLKRKRNNYLKKHLLPSFEAERIYSSEDRRSIVRLIIFKA